MEEGTSGQPSCPPVADVGASSAKAPLTWLKEGYCRRALFSNEF